MVIIYYLVLLSNSVIYTLSTVECCRGEIVIKVENIPVESSTSHPPSSTTQTTIPEASTTQTTKCQNDSWTYSDLTDLCYIYIPEFMTWQNASDYCQNLTGGQGGLASIHSNKTNSLLVTMSNYSYFWTGGFRPQGTYDWKWSDGTTWDYEGWETPKYPKTNNTRYNNVKAKWKGWGNDKNDKTYPFICQNKNPPPAKCEKGWTFLEHSGHCYKYLDTNSTFRDAVGNCQSDATSNPTANIASIPDNITNEFLATLTSKEAWIGGYILTKSNGEKEGPVFWLDGSNTSYTNWYVKSKSRLSIINPIPTMPTIPTLSWISFNYLQSKGMWGAYSSSSASTIGQAISILSPVKPSFGSLCQYNPASTVSTTFAP